MPLGIALACGSYLANQALNESSPKPPTANGSVLAHEETPIDIAVAKIAVIANPTKLLLFIILAL